MNIEPINSSIKQNYIEKLDQLEQQLNRAIENGKRECITIHAAIDRGLGNVMLEGGKQAEKPSVISGATRITSRAVKMARKMTGRGRKVKN
jgi:hypothetical protein